MATNYRLTVRKGPDAGKQHSLITDTVILGRDPLADVVINDPEVSRQHARLVRSGDEFLVQDLGSTNGTFVDGVRLGGDPVPVAPGQVVSVGSNVSLIFEAEGGEGTATLLAGGVDEEMVSGEEIAWRGVGSYDLPDMDDEQVSPEAPEFPQFQATPIEERETLLDYGSPSFDMSDAEEPQDLLPDFSFSEEKSPPFMGEQPVQYRAAPPPPPPSGPPARNNRNRNIILIMLALLLLCCCCVLVTYFWLGDLALELWEAM